MANSLRAKLKHLNHECILGNADYEDLMAKIDGHDRHVAHNAVDSYVEFCLAESKRTGKGINLRKLAESWKEQE